MTSEVVAAASVPVPGRAQRVREIATELRGLRGALIPILHAIQEELEYVDQGDIPVVADELNIAVAEVHGVVTFYHDFRRTPAGRTTVAICRAEACQSVGAVALAEHAQAQYSACGFGETTADGSADAGPGVLLRQLRARPGGPGRRQAARTGRLRPGSTRSWSRETTS